VVKLTITFSFLSDISPELSHSPIIKEISSPFEKLTEPLSLSSSQAGLMQKSFLIVVSALCIVMLVAGCTTPAPSPPTTSQQNISEQKNATEPGIVQPQQTPNTTITTPVPGTTRIQNQTTPTTTTPTVEPSLRTREIDPYVNSIGFTSYYFSFDIPGCDMNEIFPAFANDPEYGIEQPVPKLSTISAAEIRAFIRDHTMRSSENSPFKGSYSCQGVSMSPNWNFAEISAAITPRNARPATYEISLIMRAKGQNITVFTTRENLTPDQRIALVRYIPMKTDEIELLDRADITFTLVPAPALTTPGPSNRTPPLPAENVDPNVLVFKPYSNQYYTLRYPEQWTVAENAPAHTTVLKSPQGQITYSLTAIPHEANAWVVKTDKETYVNDLAGDYPGYSPESIMRDFGSCSVGDTRSCMQYAVVLPDGSYAKKVFIATMHYGHVFRIQCTDERCKNLGEYMTNSISVKDTRSN
jgi:hypothetical protein